MEIHSVRRHRFDVDVDRLWSALVAIDRYPAWWPWLTTFEPDGFATGCRWTCAVRPPLGYAVAFDLVLDEVVDAHHADATITGDIAGSARLQVQPERDGASSLRLEARLAPDRPLLKVLTAMAKPVAQRGHDWVLDTGLAQFEARAFGEAVP